VNTDQELDDDVTASDDEEDMLISSDFDEDYTQINRTVSMDNQNDFNR
jgi:hypothetical protein